MSHSIFPPLTLSSLPPCQGIFKYVFQYDNVKWWFSRRRTIDIFSHRRWVIPINENKLHWFVVVVDMKNHFVTAFDSLGDGKRKEECQTVLRQVFF